MAKGYAQHYGVDYFGMFSLLARFEIAQMLLSITAHIEWKVYRYDVKSAFVNDYLDEDVYLEQAEAFFIQGNENKVYELRKGIIWFEPRIESMVWEITFTSL